MSFLAKLFGSNKVASDKIEILNAAAYSEAISGKKVQLVDVRTKNEFLDGHISKAVNIDFFNSDNFTKSFAKMDKEKPIYLYCRSGARSRKAANKLIGMGFEKIYDLKGGYMQWK
ncbi:Thiosulfate sulfurtransferase GlpE [Arenibacter antarcticus]|uniref:Rhodanese-like domain-containing protein n=1 Tax=Arenibacter antarcticus TaxID=2040469 RepID=A0ABW5VE71_9FLAO|nr:rhodanese-like domain-containing protein [Arenibacter sp. H213]MCM4167455.1 rhodanese-like domain-containing protein [Arenibacter sp. H213]